MSHSNPTLLKSEPWFSKGKQHSRIITQGRDLEERQEVCEPRNLPVQPLLDVWNSHSQHLEALLKMPVFPRGVASHAPGKQAVWHSGRRSGWAVKSSVPGWIITDRVMCNKSLSFKPPSLRPNDILFRAHLMLQITFASSSPLSLDWDSRFVGGSVARRCDALTVFFVWNWGKERCVQLLFKNVVFCKSFTLNLVWNETFLSGVLVAITNFY